MRQDRQVWLVLTVGVKIVAGSVDCGWVRGQVAGSRYANSCAECPSSFGPMFCKRRLFEP